MSAFFDGFRDPRLRQERIFLVVALPLAALLVIGGAVILVRHNGGNGPRSPKMDPSSTEGSHAPHPSRPAATPTHFALGEEAFRTNNLPEARQHFEAALHDAEDPAKVYSALGRIDMAAANPAAAEKNFARAIAKSPGHPAHHLHRADALRALHRYDESLAELRAARELDRINPLYSNKIYLTRLSAGDTTGVQADVQAEINVGVQEYRADWLAAAAAVELANGHPERAAAFLNMLRPLVSKATFAALAADPFFDAHRNNPSIQNALSAPKN